MMRDRCRARATESARDEVPLWGQASPLALHGMLTWSPSIGKILLGRIRAENARRERVVLEKLQVSRFCSDVVVPAMKELGREFEFHGRCVDIRSEGNFIFMRVHHRERVEFRYAVLASRRRSTGKSTGVYRRDHAGYGREVDRVYSLRDVRRLSPKAVMKDIVASYKRMVAPTRAL